MNAYKHLWIKEWESEGIWIDDDLSPNRDIEGEPAVKTRLFLKAQVLLVLAHEWTVISSNSIT